MTADEIAASANRLSTPRKAKRENNQPAEAENANTKKLAPEDVEKSANRLSAPKKPPKELPPIVKSRHLAKEEEEQSVARLYDQSVRQMNSKREASLQKVLQKSVKPEQKSLDTHEIAGMVDRLCERSVAERESALERLRGRYAPEKKSKKLKIDEQSTVNSRLYQEQLQKSVEAKQKLFQKYILEKEPKMAKRSKHECADTASRLSSRPGSS